MLVVLAGCAATPIAVPPEQSATAVEVDNCGVLVEFAAAPERVVTIKSTSTEMLLALGLGDRIVGTAFQDGPVPDEWADAAADLPLISDFMPSEEVVLDLAPDLVYSGWESAFSPDAAGDRAELASLGVAQLRAARRVPQRGGAREADLRRGVPRDRGGREHLPRRPDRARRRAEGELAAIEPDDRGLTALWYSSGDDIPYVGAGTGAPQLVLDAVGLTNVAGDIDQTWTSLGWEPIVDADPDVIVLIDADWNTAASKIAAARGEPGDREAVGSGELALPRAALRVG